MFFLLHICYIFLFDSHAAISYTESVENFPIMKTSQLLYTSLLAVGSVCLAEQSIDRFVPITKYSSIDVTFPQPVVPISEVGKPAADGVITMSLPIAYSAIWQSPTQLRVIINGDVPKRSTCLLEVNLEQDKKTFLLFDRTNFYCTVESDRSKGSNHYSRSIAEPLIINVGEAWRPLFEKLVDGAFYSLFDRNSKGDIEKTMRLPANLRPLTVADVIHYKDTCSEILARTNEEEWAEFSKLPAEQVVPGYYISIPPLDNPDIHNYQSGALFIPRMGDFDIETRDFAAENVCSIDIPDNQYYLYNQQLDAGLYQVSVHFDAPVILPSQWEELLGQIEWSQETGKGARIPFKHVSGLSSMSEPTQDGYEPMLVILDVDKTKEETRTMLSSTGDMVQATHRLYFRVKKGIDDSKLSANIKMTNILGQQTEAAGLYKGRTELKPDYPTLITDSMLSVLSRKGTQELSFDYELLSNPKLRVLQLDNSGDDAVRAITAYQRYYTTYENRHKYDESIPVAARLAAQQKNSIVPTEFLTPIAVKEENLRSGTQEAKISLKDAKLFPKGDAGLYLVEFVGDSTADWNHANDKEEGAKLVTQSLVQVTDLGLLWKSNAKKRRVFFYAYSLSTGKELESARIALYDENAKLLHEQDISPNNSTLDLDKILGKTAQSVAYVHVRTKDDAYTVPFNPEEWDRYKYMSHFPNGDVAQFPFLHYSTFADRPIYRPGETAQVKGYIRQLLNNELSIPGKNFVSSFKANLQKDGDDIATYDVPIQPDGSFSIEVKLPNDPENTGNYYLSIDPVMPGDDKGTTPDLVALGLKNAKDYNYLIMGNREGTSLSLPVQHFRRNEFTVEQKMDILSETQRAKLHINAMQLTGAPVAQGELNVRAVAYDTNFYPAGLKDYRFGDYRHNDPSYTSYYYWGEEGSANGATHTSDSKYKLDEKGEYRVEIDIPKGEFPRRQKLTVFAEVTNGNKQKLVTDSSSVVHPAAAYIGMKQESKHSAKSDAGYPIDLLLVNQKGEPITASSPIKIDVNYETAQPYQYGSIMRNMVKNIITHHSLPQQEIMLDATGKGRVTIPTPATGTYTITANGLDAAGKPFRSAIVHRVYGADEKSPWERLPGVYIKLRTDKDMYKEGDTVKLLLETPVDGEVLLSLEREGIIRQIRQKVTREEPIIKFKLEKGDGPVIHLEALLIQQADNEDKGVPIVLSGNATLNIDPAEHRLAVTLDLPKESTLPGESCELRGQVFTPDGKPAANAIVTLYAEDEGTLQAGGFRMPNPLVDFYADRPHGVYSYSALGQLLSENPNERDYGNKATFVGGGTYSNDMVAYAPAALGIGGNSVVALRENFTPCALWLAQVRCDAEGRFHATAKNPDTLTQYRVIAVASEGNDNFGRGTGFYQVNKPIMLESSAPLSACTGDLVNVPVTVTMLPDELPEALRGKDVSWTVQLQGNDAVTLPEASQTITLNSNAPRTLYFPVEMKKTGDVRLEWRVTASNAQDVSLSKYNDGLLDTFTVRPPTPYLRESLFVTLDAGSQNSASSWIKTAFDPAHTRLNLTLSPSPLSGYIEPARMLSRYPYECTEQLSSRGMPLIFAEDFHLAAGTELLPLEQRKAAINYIIKSILKRRMDDYSGFSYWDKRDEASVFSPYAMLMLVEADKRGMVSRADQRSISYMLDRTKGRLLTKRDNKQEKFAVENVLWLYPLAQKGMISAAQFDTIFDKYKTEWTRHEQSYLFLALIAEMIEHPRRAEILAEANEPTLDKKPVFLLPKAHVLRLMLLAELDATSDATAQRINQALKRHLGTIYHSTLDNGWLSLMLARYIENAKLTTAVGSVNGQQIKPNATLSYMKTALSKLPSFNIGEEGKVYATGMVEGYLKNEQAQRQINKGFDIQRRYERLNPDGSWTPTAEFEVGDVVRITLLVSADRDNQYIVLEDYLPAGMEAINPAIVGQPLPPVLLGKEGQCWGIRRYHTNNMQYLKDRVRFFANWWSSSFGTTESYYLARVVKSGVMKAPAAKAEAMYEPEHYGLAVPYTITIKEKQD